MIDTAADPQSAQPAIRLDPACAQAVELAMAAARETANDQVGEHLGVRAEADRVVTHMIKALLAGYSGWYWAVTIVRAPGFEPTVAEVVLLPSVEAVLAQPWVPWSERLLPGDLSPGDLLPAAPDDPRLVPGYLLAADLEQQEVALEVGLGRVRVLSRIGMLEAADRWFEGASGPEAAMARQAPAHCGTCGFFLPIAGALRAAFGVCANEITEADGRVVSVEYGCGAHSEAAAIQQEEEVLPERALAFDDEAIDLELRSDSEAVATAAEPLPAGFVPAEVAEAADGFGAAVNSEPAAGFNAAVNSEPADGLELEGISEQADGFEPAESAEQADSSARVIPANIDVLQDLGVDLDVAP